jgi:ADP-heptose:LPS heptosyltransferase
VRERYPDAEITWAVQAKSASVVQGLPGLADTCCGTTAARAGPRLVKALWRTRLARFDTALDLQGISKAGLFLGATRAARRVSTKVRAAFRVGAARNRCPNPRRFMRAWRICVELRVLDIAPDAAERFFPRVPVTAIHRRFA